MPLGVQVQVLFRAPRLWESRSKSRTLALRGQVLFRAQKCYLKKQTRYGKTEQDEENLAELTKALKSVGLPAMGEISVLMKYTDKYK